MSIRRCGSQHFAAYNRFHNHHCHGGNFGSVFNITNKCSGGHTNFIGGFGAGLGFGLANLLGGFLGGGFNFGGFGMGGFGMGGFGFPSFGMGGFGGFGGGFGDWSMPWSSSTSSSSSKKSSSCGSGCNCKSTPVTKGDVDAKKINEVGYKVADAMVNQNLTEGDINALNAAVEELADTDGVNKEENEDAIRILKAQINALEIPKKSATVAGEPDLAGTVLKTWEDFKESGKKVSDLSKDQALEIVKSMKNADGEIEIETAEPAKLELLRKAGINVYYAHNSGDEITDDLVSGKITVKLDNNNNLEYYDIDNSNVRHMGLTWRFKYDEDKDCYKLLQITNTSPTETTYYVAPDFKDREFKLNPAKKQIEINDSPTVSTWQRDDYTPLEYTKTT